MGFSFFWGKDQGGSEMLNIPQGLPRIGPGPLPELPVQSYEIVSPSDLSGKWSQPYFASLDNEKQPS